MNSKTPLTLFLVLLLIGLLIFPMMGFAEEADEETEGFIDIEDHKYEEAITFIADLGIVSGYSDGTYQPATVLNRAELLKIVIEAAYEDEFENYSSESCFYDVPPNEWFTPYVCFAKDQGIVEGYSDGNFQPAQEIVFVEALKIATFELGYYEADDYIWYKSLVDGAATDALIPLDVTAFDQEFTRGQMAELITRTLKFQSDELDEYLEGKSRYRVTYMTINAGAEMEAWEEDFLKLLNDYREENGADPLEIDSALDEAAMDHSIWMAENETLSHIGEDGSEFYERCYAAGSFCLSENAAYNSWPTPQAFFTSWKESPGHDENMLRTSYNGYIGIGMYDGYATTDFQ
ncbi:MAG: S-layer homology domain-containing protein [Candidatus Peregrinibacteria bacterium]|nr:S-layer homology domain-containing protein [Candidatus Peregrinibacteria bacterium]